GTWLPITLIGRGVAEGASVHQFVRSLVRRLEYNGNARREEVRLSLGVVQPDSKVGRQSAAYVPLLLRKYSVCNVARGCFAAHVRRCEIIGALPIPHICAELAAQSKPADAGQRGSETGLCSEPIAHRLIAYIEYGA